MNADRSAVTSPMVSDSTEAGIRGAIAGTASKAEPSQTNLEDVFINLMRRSTDNFEPQP